MGLLQRAIETYDNMIRLAGIEEDGREPLAPVAHNTARASIEITLDEKGNFIEASKCDRKIVIPVTEESAGRSGTKVSPHPLCDQLGYISNTSIKKYEEYLRQLRSWCESEYRHPKAEAVYSYVTKSSVLKDLEKAGIIEPPKNGKLKDEKTIICWRIIGLGDESGPVWTDTSLHEAYAQFYINCFYDNQDEDICYLTGERKPIAMMHLKGVVGQAPNAKIISDNDDANFTYRGERFNKNKHSPRSKEALSISYEASQKAHNALKWIIANDNVSYNSGDRCFVAWSPKGIVTPRIDNPLYNISDKNEIIEPTHYKKKLQELINGYKNTLPNNETVVIAGFEAATNGRLSITYYNELNGSDFLARLKYWDETCCWYDNYRGTASPTLRQIIHFAFGTERRTGKSVQFMIDSKDKNKKPKIEGRTMQQLLACKLDGAMFPFDVMRNLKNKADNLQIVSDINRNKLLLITCAAIRKFRIDHFKEEFAMSLDVNCQDRSYQFGRLLAVMERIEKATFDRSVSRESNAIRMQPIFTQRPGYTAKVIINKLKSAYYPRLSPGSRVFYDRIIGDIMEQISQFGIDEFDRPLTETYLLGYYLQKNEIFKGKSEVGSIEKGTEV